MSRRARLGIAVVALVLAGAIAGTPGLAADAGHQEDPRSRAFVQPTIELGEHNGYTVEVAGKDDRVYLSVSRGNSISIYAAPGTATADRIEARFGEFGRVSMRFHVSADRTWNKPRRQCRGKHLFVNRRGAYSGTVNFKGERGYVSVRSHRAAGVVTTIAPKCLRKIREAEQSLPLSAARAARSGPLPAFLTARRQDVRSVTYLGAEKLRRGTSFFAESSESRGRVAIIRYAYADGGLGRLRIDDSLESATVSPPAPFHGSATFSAAADGSKAWEGSLTATFPGAPRTPLTGDGFKVRLSAGY